MTRNTPPESIVRRSDWPESISRPIGTPLQPSVAYVSSDPDELDAQYEGGVQGFTYARERHPNAEVLAAKLDMLEGMSGGIVTSSGMSAIAAVLMGLLSKGDHVVAGDQLYGRSLRLLTQDLPRLGISTTLVDPTRAEAVKAAMRPETKVLLFEIVSNPTLRIADMSGIAAVARGSDALLVVDNTFTTPRALRARDVGADIVVHSVTKLLAGHSDVTLGYVAAREPEERQRLLDFTVSAGLTPSPFDCWLAERGMHTFDLRYNRACTTAAALSGVLADHDKVIRVLYPGRNDHPDGARMEGILNGQSGNMVSFELRGGRSAANAFVRAATEFLFAPTLGDVATTLSHPASSSHRALSPEARAALGISEGFFRVSVGVEETDLVTNAMQRALDVI